MVQLPKFKSFCGCLSLKTGCLFIGYLEVATNSFGTYNFLTNDEVVFEDIILNLILSIYLILINLLLVWAVHKEKKKAILPWLISKFIGYAIFTIIMGYQIYESIDLVTDVGMHKYQLLILGINIIIITVLSLAWSSLCLVFSYYSTLTILKSASENEKGKKEN